MSIPKEFQSALTMNGVIPVSYVGTSLQPKAPLRSQEMDAFIEMAKANKAQSPTDLYIYQAFTKFPLAGKKVALLGPTNLWHEAMLLAEKSILSAQASSGDTRICDLKMDSKYDAICSFLYLKNLGLGSSIDPDADFEEMKRAKNLLKSDGLLFLSIPLGKDRLIWNSHRIYGERRMKALFKGWRPTAYFGYSYEDLLKDSPRLHEPVIVLKPI
jgi:hypothetical protein